MPRDVTVGAVAVASLPLRRCVTGAPLRRSLRHRRGNETVKQRRQRRERFDSNSSNPLKTFFRSRGFILDVSLNPEMFAADLVN